VHCERRCTGSRSAEAQAAVDQGVARVADGGAASSCFGCGCRRDTKSAGAAEARNGAQPSLRERVGSAG
jgi:hypothetical protein